MWAGKGLLGIFQRGLTEARRVILNAGRTTLSGEGALGTDEEQGERTKPDRLQYATLCFLIVGAEQADASHSPATVPSPPPD